jgi:hypothetical protein
MSHLKRSEKPKLKKNVKSPEKAGFFQSIFKKKTVKAVVQDTLKWRWGNER